MLSKNQKKLLIILARTNGTYAPLGKEFVHRANIPKASMEQSLNFLEKKDYIFKKADGATGILDPLIKAVLASTLT